MKYLLSWWYFLGVSLTLYAQDTELLGSYTKADVRKYCWETNAYDPEETYPASWDNQSMICLKAEYRYFFYDTERTNTVVSFMGHYRYKLLDQAAVDEFSEVYYKDIKCKETYVTCINGIGIRVIKPNGRVVEVEDTTIISMDDNRNKVAIPALGIGDVLDYYVFGYVNYPDEDLGKYVEFDRTLVRNEYPIKQFCYSVVTNVHWEMTYNSGEYNMPLKQRIFNAKPDWRTDKRWKRKEKTERFYEYSLEKTDIPPIEVNLWNYYYRTNPYLKLVVRYDYKHLDGVLDTSKVWYRKKMNTVFIQNNFYTWLNIDAVHYDPGYQYFDHYMKKKYGRKLNIPQHTWIEEWYYYVRYRCINEYYIQDRKSGEYGKGTNAHRPLRSEKFIRYMVYGLTKRKIRHDLIFVENRNEGRIEDVVSIDELDVMVRIHLGSKNTYYAYEPDPYMDFNTVPYLIEGTQSYYLRKTTYNPFNIGFVTDAHTDFKVKKVLMGETADQENRLKVMTKVTFSKDDPTILQTQNELVATGHQCYSYKYDVLDWIGMIQKEHLRYDNQSLIDSINNEEYSAFRKSEAEEREERLQEMMVDYFAVDADDIAITGNSVTSSANLPGEDSLHFQVDCTIKGFVKKVGSNYILQLGKLTGDQLLLEEEDLERTTDIYMPYARGYEYTIEVTIPEGYEVKGLDKFTNNIDNETGSLISSAILEGNVITLRFRKYYKHHYEPKENWDKMIAFIQPGAEFLTKEVLLKKKRG